MIRIVKDADAAQIAEIYNHYILNTLITFEEQPVTPEEILARIKSITTEYPWLVYEEDGRVVGYAYATRWKERSAYRRTVEAAIYLDVRVTGRHIGSQLTAALLDALRVRKIHSVLAGIALPNSASVGLCEKFGFAKVGELKEVGYKLDQWVDVGYWELILDNGEDAKNYRRNHRRISNAACAAHCRANCISGTKVPCLFWSAVRGSRLCRSRTAATGISRNRPARLH